MLNHPAGTVTDTILSKIQHSYEITESPAYVGEYCIPTLPENNPSCFTLFAATCSINSYNCTSLVVNLLEEAGINTDMSRGCLAVFAISQVLFALSLGYSVGEFSQLINYLSNETSHDDNLTDEILGIVTVVACFAILLSVIPLITASSSPNKNPRLKDCINKHARNHFYDKNPLTYFTKAFATETAVIFILSVVGFVIHCSSTPFTFEASPSEVRGLVAGAGVGLVSIIVTSVIGLCVDCKGGVTNPYGLKLLLELFAETEVPPENDSHHNETLDIQEEPGRTAIGQVNRPISINRLGAARATTDGEINQPLLNDSRVLLFDYETKTL